MNATSGDSNRSNQQWKAIEFHALDTNGISNDSELLVVGHRNSWGTSTTRAVFLDTFCLAGSYSQRSPVGRYHPQLK